MAEVTYHIIEHDGGFAYKVGDTVSETFVARQDAVAAAHRAAAEQQAPGEAEIIDYQDRSGFAHEETVAGDDRPATRVEE